MQATLKNQERPDLRVDYEPPQILQKGELVIELQTNYIPDEPPPPL